MLNLFALALVLAPPDAAAIDRARDLEFERAQVAWIAANSRVPSLESVIPREHAELIRLLGDPRHLVRELAADRLAWMGQSASTALAWGLRVGDPEIVRASGMLRDRLYECPPCRGSGDCPDCHVDDASTTFRQCLDCIYRRCRTCQGGCDLRYVVADRYTEDGYAHVYEVRDLFARP